MSTVEFIKSSLAFAHRALADARNGTPEQLHFVPEQGPHSIAWCLWHTARVEDLMGARITGEPQIWDETWAQRTGLPHDGFGTGQPDEEARRVQITDVDAFTEYQEAVWERTKRFLDSATDADLERELPARQGTESVGQAIQRHMIGHFNGHRGEMNLLRGMQGMPPLLVREGTH